MSEPWTIWLLVFVPIIFILSSMLAWTAQTTLILVGVAALASFVFFSKSGAAKDLRQAWKDSGNDK